MAVHQIPTVITTQVSINQRDCLLINAYIVATSIYAAWSEGIAANEGNHRNE